MIAIRFSLRWLFFSVLLIAVCLAGLAYPSPVYAGLLASALLIVAATAIVAAIVSPGRHRAVGLGILVFVGSYGIAVWKFESTFRLTAVFDQLHSVFFEKTLSEPDLAKASAYIVSLRRIVAHAKDGHFPYERRVLARLQSSMDAAATRDSFVAVSKGLLGLLAAACGAFAGVWFYDRREPATDHTPSATSP